MILKSLHRPARPRPAAAVAERGGGTGAVAGAGAANDPRRVTGNVLADGTYLICAPEGWYTGQPGAWLYIATRRRPLAEPISVTSHATNGWLDNEARSLGLVKGNQP